MHKEDLCFIPNKPGLISKENDAKKLTSAIDDWKEMEEERNRPNLKKISYWQSISNSAAL